jgi:hypothetical protein
LAGLFTVLLRRAATLRHDRRRDGHDPEGALADTLQITITETDDRPPAGFTAVSKIFRREPSGPDFAVRRDDADAVSAATASR